AEGVDGVAAPAGAAGDPGAQYRLLGGRQWLLRRHLVVADALVQGAVVRLARGQDGEGRLLAREVEATLGVVAGVAIEAAPRQQRGDVAVEVRRGRGGGAHVSRGQQQGGESKNAAHADGSSGVPAIAPLSRIRGGCPEGDFTLARSALVPRCGDVTAPVP